MINAETINNIYESVLNNKELTTKELNSYGFNSKDISKLIEQEIIKRTERGHYIFLDFNGLYSYGKDLLRKKEEKQAAKYFEIVFNSDPNNVKVAFDLFFNRIYNDNYEEAFKYFEVLSQTKNTYFKSDCNLYLYLLSFITEIPEKYQNDVKNLKIDDVKIRANDRRYSDVAALNKIIVTAFGQKFPYALKLLNNYRNSNSTSSNQSTLLKILLKKVVINEQKIDKVLLEAARNQEYEKIIDILENKEKVRDLGWINSYILKLAKEMIKIIDTQIVPEIQDIKQDNIFEAITAHNYELALSLNIKYYQEMNMNIKNSTLAIILTNICKMIKQIENEKETKNSSAQQEIKVEPKEEVQEEIEVFQIKEEKNKLITKTPNIVDVINHLLSSNFEKANIFLEEFLKSIAKEKYTFLIKDLIKISLLEKDEAFMKPILTLMDLNNDTFNFDVQEFIQKFYISLSQQRFEEARIYLDIISEGYKLEDNMLLIDNLKRILENAEPIIKPTIQVLNKPIDEMKVETINTNKKQQTIIEADTKKDEKTTPNRKPIQNISAVINENYGTKISNDDRNFIQKKYDILEKEHGIIILKPMTKSRRKEIYRITKEFPNLDVFSIGESDCKQIVLRYKTFDKSKNYNEILERAKKAYYDKQYTESINCYLDLTMFNFVKPYIYARLGLAYLKKGEKLKAIDYLTVATDLTKNDPYPSNFKDLINAIECSMTGTIEQKPNFQLNPSFFNDMNQNFGITNFDQINNLVVELGLDVKSTCEKLGMSDEQICLVKILYAIKYYSQGDYKQGDTFFKAAEQASNKSLKVIKALEEVKAKKKFYTYREQEKIKALNLNIKPN